jgi:hypothetical protein
MFDIEDKLNEDINYFKLNMNATQKLTFYINEYKNKDDFKFDITFYNYASEKITAEHKNDNTSTLITYKETKTNYTYKKFMWIKYYTKKTTIIPAIAELNHVNNETINIRVFGEIALTELKNIIKRWAIDNEIKINYNVELVIDYYVVKEREYKYIWQMNYKTLK